MIPIASTPISISELFPIRRKSNYFGILTDSGRSALKIALEQIPKKTKRIALAAYTCPVLYDLIVMCGFIPVAIDVELDSFEMIEPKLEKEINDGLDAILVVHLFGKFASVDKIREISRDIPIIEDCAQYLIPSYLPKGDFAIFSFGLGKVITCGGGGALMVNNGSFIPVPEKIGSSLVPLLKIWGMKFGTIPFLYRKKMSLRLEEPVWKLNPRKMGDTLSANLSKQLENLPQTIGRRRQNARMLCDLLHQEFDSFSYEKIYTRFVIQWKNPAGLRDRLFKKGIESELPYPRLNQIIPKRLLPNTAFAIATNLSLPINHRVKERDLHTIADTINGLKDNPLFKMVA